MLPDYRIETALYTALPAMAALYGRAAIDNLHDRVGDEEQLRGSPHNGDGEWANGAWGRGFYWSGHHDGGTLGVYSDQGPTFDYEMEGLQMGLDIYRHEDADGRRDQAGAYIAAGQVSGKVSHINDQIAGEDTIQAYSLGGYWTHFWASGAYLDGVAQVSWYDIKAQSVRLPALKGDAMGYALSLEGGAPWHVATAWVIEPQAQLTWQTFDKTSSSDVGGAVTIDNTDSLIGRLGLRAAHTWLRDEDTKTPLQTTGWLRLNIDHQFMDQPKTTFASETGPVSFQANIGSTWAELTAGFTHQMSLTSALYGSAGYQRNFDQDNYAWTVKLGGRVNW